MEEIEGVKEQDIVIDTNGERASRVRDSSLKSETVCFICGVQSATWAVYSKSREGPFFPFLEFHTPPQGSKSIDPTTGKVDCCTVCFSFLTQQWHAFEASDTPVIKRLYWLKRPGSDTGSEKKFSGQEKTSEKPNSCVGSKQSFADQKGAGSDHERMADGEIADRITAKSARGSSRKELSSINCVKVETSESSQRDCDSPNNPFTGGRKSALETCFICSRRKPKEFMRSVHTRPQLKTETPFYPCLARHSPAATAKKMDYLGKVLVCEACQKFLFRQWQVFQRNATPLGERQYQLRSDPTLPREQQSSLSTMVCFICGVTQPATSGRFLYSCKHAPGEAFYPFLAHLTPPPGAMPLTQQGLTRACSGCRKSLHRQWKQFEALKVCEEEREYRIRNDRVVSSSPMSDQNIPSTNNMIKISCYICGESCVKCDLKLINSKVNACSQKEKMYFPFIISIEPPSGCRPLDDSGRTLACKKCFRYLQEKWEEYESMGIPMNQRNYKSKLTNEKLDKQKICFLCGIAVKLSAVHKLFLYPHGGTGVKDGGPFFPFLASKEPAHNAQLPDSEGTISACEICCNNLLMQWLQYEKSNIPEEANRWQRKYYTTTVRCYICGIMVPRSHIGLLNIKHVSLPDDHKPPADAVIVNVGRDIVVCEGCHISYKSKFSRDEPEHFRSYHGLINNVNRQVVEGKCSSPDKGSQLTASDRDPVIVVNSSDSEDDGSKAVTTKKIHSYVNQERANVALMHYTISTSPIAQPSLHTKDSSGSPSPNTAMQSNSRNQASFAAALRKLAKQAVPPSGSSSPVTSAGGAQSPNPHSLGKQAGMSPSRNSPKSAPTPPLARQDVSAPGLRDRPDKQASPGFTRICTPPKHPALSADLDHRSQGTDFSTITPRISIGYQSVQSSISSGEGLSLSEAGRDPRTPHSRETENHSPKVGGHQVMPGVFSCGPRGTLQEGPMLSEHFPVEHPPPHVPHYLHAMKPEPIFGPRSGAVPGPLLASGRDGHEPHIVPAFYPSHFPPHMNIMDPLAETWRQRRAVEHLRQQHERHTHIWPDEVPHSLPSDLPRHIHPGGVKHFRPREPLPIRTEDAREHLHSGKNEHFRQHSDSLRARNDDLREREARKQVQERDSQDLRPSSVERTTESKGKENDSPADERKSSPGHGHRAGIDQMPVIQRVYYYNDNKSSCPVHGHGPPTTSVEERPRSHSSGPVPIETGHGPKPDGAEDPRGYSTKADLPDGLGRLYGRRRDHTEEIGRMFGSKPEGSDEFGRLYGHKPEDHGRLMFHRHPDAQLLQPYLIHHMGRERPFPGLPIDEQQAEVLRESHRQEMLLHQRMMFDPKDHLKLQEPGWQPWQHHLRQQKDERGREVSGFHHQHLLQQQEMEKRDLALKEPRIFQDQDRPKHCHPDGLREHRAGHQVGFHGNQYPFSDSFPFYPERLGPNTSGSNKSTGEHDWRKHDKSSFLNGDYQPPGQRSFSREEVTGSRLEEAVKRIKVEKPDDDLVVQPTPRVTHEPGKLRFLEGLGLVTVYRKKELSQGEPSSLKRKFEEEKLPNEIKTQVELNQGKDSEETSEETASDADSAATSTDNDFNAEAFSEKMEFMSKLGLVPPHRRQEMEKSFELRRSERKMRKSRGRPKKRARKEVDRDSENNPPILDIEKLSGPITRNRQQLIAEQEQLLGLAHSRLEEKKADKLKDEPPQIPSHNKDRRSPFIAEYHDTGFDQKDNERHAVRSSPDPTRAPPRLTLKSLTNMEDPFTNSSASTFRPPYLRHTGLLSISKDHPSNAVMPVPPNSSELNPPPIRPEPVRSSTRSYNDLGTRDYLSGRPGLAPHLHHPPRTHELSLAGSSASDSGRNFENDPSKVLRKESAQNAANQEERPGAKILRWPGVEAIMQAYYLHAAENEVERNVLREDSEVLRTHNSDLNDQAEQLSMRMTDLVKTKRQLLENKRTLRAELDKLHFFVQSFQR